MAMFSNTEVDAIIAEAEQTLFSMPSVIERERMFSNNQSLQNEMDIIFDLKKAVEWGKGKMFSDPEYHGVVAYLKYKVNGYGYGGKIPMYAQAITPGNQSVAPIQSGYQFFIQLVTGTDIAIDSTSYTNSNLIGRYVVVSLDGTILPVGVSHTKSYTYNINTGAINLNEPLAENQVLIIFTYIPTLVGWQVFDSFVVGPSAPMSAGDTIYSNGALVGKSVAVVLNQLLLPINLEGTVSYSYSSLTGIINFNQGVEDGQPLTIYIF
jgi:hypothetical protein